jgi:SnoaL-like domain
MASHPAISPQEAADRLAIRELVDAYAHCADRRDAKGQMALFTTGTRFLVFMDPTVPEPTQELHGRESLAPVFDNLNTYAATMHFNGQSTVVLDGDRATGESYCLAHHLSVAGDGQRTMMIASIRYLDEFVKQDGQWLFAERRLMVNWTETRPSSALCPISQAGANRPGSRFRRAPARPRPPAGSGGPGCAAPCGSRPARMASSRASAWSARSSSSTTWPWSSWSLRPRTAWPGT